MKHLGKNIFPFLLLGLLAGSLWYLPVSRNNILHNEAKLFAYFETHGTEKTLERLEKIEKEESRMGACHAVAHKVGDFSYKKFGSRAFELCTERCGGGCYHGAIGVHAGKYGTTDFKKTLSKLCLESERYDQCLHGLGHGLVAWVDFELFEALKLCEEVSPEPYKQDECWRGVFMENVLGTFAHQPGLVSKYLSDDPAYPCTIVQEKYKHACYQMAIFRVGQLYGKDLKKTSEVCLAIPKPYNQLCFSGLGSNSFRVEKNLEAAISICNLLPQLESRSLCLYGAAEEASFGKSKTVKKSICREIKEKTDISAHIYNAICPEI